MVSRARRVPQASLATPVSVCLVHPAGADHVVFLASRGHQEGLVALAGLARRAVLASMASMGRMVAMGLMGLLVHAVLLARWAQLVMQGML